MRIRAGEWTDEGEKREKVEGERGGREREGRERGRVRGRGKGRKKRKRLRDESICVCLYIYFSQCLGVPLGLRGKGMVSYMKVFCLEDLPLIYAELWHLLLVVSAPHPVSMEAYNACQLITLNKLPRVVVL